MERVTFVIERTGERISCLLNPETFVVRRVAGVRPLRSVGGQLAGARLADDPLLYTGGGTTELLLDLLFDVGLPTFSKPAGAPSAFDDDVRTHTAPLMRLAENAASEDPYGRPPLVRFVWGKSWNVPGVVVTVAERYDYFTPEGTPRRSWMRMRLVRVAEPPSESRVEPEPRPPIGMPDVEVPEDEVLVHDTMGDASDGETPGTTERLDQLAERYYGDPSLWRVIAEFNDVADPAHVKPGAPLRIPPRSALTTSA